MFLRFWNSMNRHQGHKSVGKCRSTALQTRVKVMGTPAAAYGSDRRYQSGRFLAKKCGPGRDRTLICLILVSINDIGHQSDLTGALDGLGDLALVHGARAGGTAGQDLAAIAGELLELCHVLVIHKRGLIHAELAYLSALAGLRSAGGIVGLIESQGFISRAYHRVSAWLLYILFGNIKIFPTT